MTSGFAARPEQLDAKADAIGEVASGVRECVSAADEMGVGGLVYGVLFDPTLLPILSEAKDALKSMIGSVGDAADQIAQNLHRNAATYSSVEQFLQQHFSQLQGSADGGSGG